MSWRFLARKPDGVTQRIAHSPSAGWLLAGLLLLVHPVFAAQIEVSLDRNPVPINESFTLSFTANESPDDDPDFAPLQANFEVLNQSQSSQVAINNGRATRHLTWQVQVMAKKPGTLEIPPIAFGKDSSRPFAVTITHGAVTGKQGGEASIALEAEAEPKNPYVQSQVLLTLRVLSRVAFSGDLGAPEVPDAVVEKLDEDREYVTMRDGMQFKVNERRYVIFPQKSGRLTIGAINLTAQMGGASFGPFYRPSARQQRLHSDPIELEVRAIPAEFKGRHWLPATRMALEEQWQPSSLSVAGGEPVTRTVTIKGEGVTVGQLPELDAADLPSAAIKQYPDQPVTQEGKAEDGLVSQRQEKTAFIATQAGKYIVPALEVPWWNTVTDRLEAARLPAHELTVTPAAGVAEVPALTPALPAVAEQPATTEAPAGLAPQVSAGFWPWLAALFALGWLVTGLAWWRSGSSGKKQIPIKAVSAGGPERSLVRSLESACRSNDAAAARQAFDRWTELRWPDIPYAGRARLLNEPLRSKLDELNRRLFSDAEGLAWDGSDFVRVFKAFIAESDNDSARKPPNEALATLYKGSPASR